MENDILNADWKMVAQNVDGGKCKMKNADKNALQCRPKTC